MFDLPAYLELRRREVDDLLARKLPAEGERPAALHAAMRYAVLEGGKRLRPILCMAAAEAAGGSPSAALPAGAAIELLHAYTLVHDDLPAMDNDALRRGRPTVHVQFGEANAILAGDALLTLAFEWMAECVAPPPHPPNCAVLELARAAGSRGVIGGQVEDMAAEGAPPTAERVAYIHEHKTGDLILAAVRIGGILGGANTSTLEALTTYAQRVGLAFQIADDVLNAASTAEQIGKGAGSDRDRGKMTWVAVHGLDAARRDARRLADEAARAIRHCPGLRDPLETLARFAVERAT